MLQIYDFQWDLVVPKVVEGFPVESNYPQIQKDDLKDKFVDHEIVEEFLNISVVPNIFEDVQTPLKRQENSLHDVFYRETIKDIFQVNKAKDHFDTFIDQPKYDENPDDLGKQSFDSTELFSTKPMYDNYKDNERNAAKLLDLFTICIFDPQLSENSKPTSIILKPEFGVDIKQTIIVNEICP